MRLPKLSSETAIALDQRYGANNYSPLPVVLAKGMGAKVWDLEGREYLDFLSAYSAVNQGHCHPKIVEVFCEQARTLTLTSRAFYSEQLARFTQVMCETFGYERVLPMNTGVEAVETGLKLARRWGYEVKKVSEGRAKIVVCEGNFHGRTIAAVSASTSESARRGFGPYLPGFVAIPFGDSAALKVALQDPDVVGFLFEPIQGEAGVRVPEQGYLTEAWSHCRGARVLMIADEIQTGIARTGRMLACDHENVKPDIVLLGKALSGGMMPVSAVLTSSEVMLCIRPGEHGSTFGGNPLACATVIAALRVIKDESLCERSSALGELFRKKLRFTPLPLVKEVRGKGLLNAVEITPAPSKSALEICLKLKDLGVLAKPTRDTTIRFSPPLVIAEEDLRRGLEQIMSVLR